MQMIRPGGEGLTRRAIAMAGVSAGARVLVLGCGEGDSVRLLKEELGCDACGIDLSREGLAAGRARHPELELLEMGAEKLNFSDEEFDAALAECTFSVLEDPAAAAGEAFRVLKPGGKLVVTDLYSKSEGAESAAKVFLSAGFELLSFSDESAALSEFVARAILDYGSVEEYFKAATPAGEPVSRYCPCSCAAADGYCIMLLRKPAKGK